MSPFNLSEELTMDHLARIFENRTSLKQYLETCRSEFVKCFKKIDSSINEVDLKSLAESRHRLYPTLDLLGVRTLSQAYKSFDTLSDERRSAFIHEVKKAHQIIIDFIDDELDRL
ncbi:MAG: hypothetical protein RL226_1551 [Bacteroidota bacterium]|jgi:hypothetical protein